MRYVLETTDGEYRCQALVLAVGVAEPWTPSAPGIEHARHYAETRAAETYAGKRIFILGKQNSGFELASGLSAWASRIVVASPSPAKLSVQTRSLVGVRARYVQPFEDHYLGLGVSILDAALEPIDADGERPPGRAQADRHRDAGRPRGRRGHRRDRLRLPAARSARARGGDLRPEQPAVGHAVLGERRRCPASTSRAPSARRRAGLKKHGIPSNSGAVHGARYNARILARHVAEEHFGIVGTPPLIEEADLLGYLLDEATRGPELWHQKAYLARVVEIVPEIGIRDLGVLPLAHVLDAGGPDAIAMTVEADGAGAIYPVVYLRRKGRLEEHALARPPAARVRDQRARRGAPGRHRRARPGVARDRLSHDRPLSAIGQARW